MLIQGVSLLAVIGLERSLSSFTPISLNIAGAALVQGACAAALTRWRGLAPWWLPIQALFPIAALAMLSLQLPPWIFLLAFVFMLGLYWSTYRTQVPYYPSGRAVRDAVARLMPADRPLRVIDIGSGLGGLALDLARRRPESVIEGIELAPLPWLLSWLRARLCKSGVRFYRGDYDNIDLAPYDLVYAYLSPAAMPALWRKASAEMRPGALLLSYEFTIPGVEPDLVVAPSSCGRALHGWRMKIS